MAIPSESTPRTETIIIQHRIPAGTLAGILGCIFGVLGIFFIAIVFVPLAALCAITALVRGINSRNGSAIGLSLVAGFLCFFGFITSPSLLLLFGAGLLTGLIATHQSASPAAYPLHTLEPAPLARTMFQAHMHRAEAKIGSSLYLAALHAGIPADTTVDMIRMFSYKVNFKRDLHPGDSFEVYYSYDYTPEGQPAKEGNISYARMNLGGKNIVLYRYQPDANLAADYFDAAGRSAEKILSGSELHSFLEQRIKVDVALASTPLQTGGETK